MEQRLNIAEILPQNYQAVYALSNSFNKESLPSVYKHLIKIRASQINSCAFCLDMHTREALKSGESQQRIFLLNAWKETHLFTEEERIVLKITEEITLIHLNGLSEETYQEAKMLFSKETIAEIIMVVVQINAWNRIAVSSLMPLADKK